VFPEEWLDGEQLYKAEAMEIEAQMERRGELRKAIT
jgi:hypothetical protein